MPTVSPASVGPGLLLLPPCIVTPEQRAAGAPIAICSRPSANSH